VKTSLEDGLLRVKGFVAVIHVLEDDPGVSDSLRSLLQALGLTVASYRDGESFMDAPPPGEDDVVIVDLGLPGIGGAQVVRWIEQLDPSPRIIVISGQPQKAIDDALIGSNIHHVLRKPLSGDALTSLLMS
jgi:FixJ family two-component response regulator